MKNQIRAWRRRRRVGGEASYESVPSRDGIPILALNYVLIPKANILLYSNFEM